MHLEMSMVMNQYQCWAYNCVCVCVRERDNLHFVLTSILYPIDPNTKPKPHILKTNFIKK